MKKCDQANPLHIFRSKDRYGREYVLVGERRLFIRRAFISKLWAVVDEESDVCITTSRGTKQQALNELIRAERNVRRSEKA